MRNFSGQEPWTPMPHWLAKTLLILAGFLAALGLMEAGLRLAGVEYPMFYDYDPHLGGKLRPGIKGRWLKEGGGYVSINRDGLRDREHDLHKPPHTLRIAVLGDSFAEAMQVNREEAFWAVMEAELGQCPTLEGRPVEVINFGQSGFGTTQELLAWRHRARKYRPDLVLLAFFTGNDVADNSRALKQVDYHPYQVFRDGQLVLDDRITRERWREKTAGGWRQAFSRWQMDHLRLAQVRHQAVKAWEEWRRHRHRQGHSEAADPMAGGGLYQEVYREPTDPVWQEAWKVTEAALLMLRDEVTRTGARLLVVVLTNSIQVHPDPVVRQAFARRLGVADLFYPDRRLEQFCKREGIPVLLLAPSFQEYATTHQVFVHGFPGQLGSGHWNQRGHRLAGETLARWLCGLGR